MLPVSRTRTAVLALVAAGCLSAASCGGSTVALHPVTGAVFYGDQPAEGATVVFHLKEDDGKAPKPSGTVGPDGAFTLSTYPHGKGAPAGEYVVTVTWLPPNARELKNPKNKLPEAYALPTTSPIRATVTDGPTQLEPFRLAKP